MRNRRRMKRTLHADMLEAALTHQDEDRHPRTDELVRTAGLLKPGVPIRESKRTETKERMLRIAASEWATTPPPGPGSRDGCTPGPEVHTAEVDLPDGQVYLADVESITPQRAAEIAQEVATLDRLSGEL